MPILASYSCSFTCHTPSLCSTIIKPSPSSQVHWKQLEIGRTGASYALVTVSFYILDWDQIYSWKTLPSAGWELQKRSSAAIALLLGVTCKHTEQSFVFTPVILPVDSGKRCEERLLQKPQKKGEKKKKHCSFYSRVRAVIQKCTRMTEAFSPSPPRSPRSAWKLLTNLYRWQRLSSLVSSSKFTANNENVVAERRLMPVMIREWLTWGRWLGL